MEDNNIKKKRIIMIGYIVIAIAFFMLFSFMTYRKLQQADLDADFSSLIIESNDFVNGNFFLNGWNQTGISFFLTDFLFFSLGSAIFGLSKTSYLVGITVMIVAAFAAGMLLIDKKNKASVLLYIALAAFPTSLVVGLQRAHTGGYIWTFIALAVIWYSLNKEKLSKLSMAVIAIMFAMCSMSDMATVIFGAGALIIVVAYKLIFDQRITDKKLYIKLLITTIAGIIIGFVMDKLYYMIGSCNKNGFMGGKGFEAGSEWINKTLTYFNCVFTLGNSDIMSAPAIFSKAGILGCFYAIFVIAAFVVIIKNVINFIKSKDNDFIASIMSVGYVLVGIAYIFTDIGIDIYSSRYFAVQPIIFAVILCREYINGNYADKLFYTSRIKYKYIVNVAIVLLILCGMYRFTYETGEEFITPQEKLGMYLESQGLENGYANYWECAAATVASNGKSSLRAIMIDDNYTADMYCWFCKDEWYSEYANYVVFDEVDQQEMGVTKEKVEKTFGSPQKILKYESYTIYVYDYDLSSRIAFNQ